MTTKIFCIDGLPNLQRYEVVVGHLGREGAPLENIQNNTWLLADMEFSSRDIELNTRRGIPYLRAPIHYLFSL